MTTARPIGRPRDERANRAILQATLELIAERGVHGFRTEDVAARARVGKGAIYRRQPSKDDLVMAAVAGGPLFYRLLITGGPLDEQLAEDVTELILRGFAPDKPGRAKSTRTTKEHS
jgi:AcrR family transcriptional regulator